MPQIMTNVDEAGDALARLVANAGVVAGFTGAGISTECGVPDFRSPGSPWMVNKPIPFQAFVASAEARREAWRRKFAMDDSYAHAQPGQGHRALAALHRAGKMPRLITQNIDGLHQRSGLPDEAVIELHGNGGYAKCLECDDRMELADIRPTFEADGDAPPCPSCGGVVKSATVSFGQAMPQREMAWAAKVALRSDLFLAIGSSLVVYPAANLPRAAAENGAILVILNREGTDLDRLAEVVIRCDIGPTLTRMQRVLGV
jgi:NAD-dependent deacetylase